MEEVCEGKDFSFPKQEEKILHYWSEIKAFETQLALTKDLPEYVFYDGPPFATGLPHYGHILAGTIKDIITRYQSMTGHHVTRRFGWDCHGLPVENEIDKKLDITRREQIMEMGIGKYNEACRSIVTRYVEEWEKVITRTGRWIDFRNDYKTMDLNFMESVWWVFAQIYDKGLVYKGFKVMPYSTGCKTPLSNFEANQDYKDVPDPEVMVAFPILGDSDEASFVAWTTTPWTLPSHLALCVNANFTYLKVRNKYSKKVYVVAESRLSALPNDKPKENVPNGSVDSKKSNSKSKGSSGGKKEAVDSSYEVLQKMSGASLVGTKYEPPFDYFKEFSDVAFRVVADNYVTDDSGTGIVHCAPAFGEDDYRVCLENKVINKGETLIVAVDEDGCFTEKITDFRKCYVKNADKDIIEAVKRKGRLVKSGTIMHSYPHCPRSKTPLIQRAVPSWFIRVEQLKEKLLENNKQTYWVPDFVKEKRFHNWLENARDWAVSRSRFWGTPLPVWISEDGEEIEVMDSIKKLEERSGVKRDERIEKSVARMMTIIDLARNIRERHNKPLKTPLREMVIVHPDMDFLDDIAGKLKEYVLEELNVRSLVPCNDTLKYASLRAETDFSVLGKRLGKHMGIVAKEVKAMSQESILAFEKSGEVTFSGHCLKMTDIKVVRDFKRPDGTAETEVDATGDGDVLVILDLRPDESLFDAGVAREAMRRGSTLTLGTSDISDIPPD